MRLCKYLPVYFFAVASTLLLSFAAGNIAQQPTPEPTKPTQIQTADVRPDLSDLPGLENALNEAVKSNDKTRQAETLNLIGRYYNQHNGFDKALEYFERARTLFSALGEKKQEAIVAYNIGGTEFKLAKYTDAQRDLISALTIFRQLGLDFYIGRAVNDLGILSKMNNDIDGAIKYGEEALSIFRSIKDSENQTLAMSFLSSYYYIAGKPLKVLELDAELEKIYETNGDKSRLAVVDYTIGALKSNGADRAEALKYLERAAQLAHETGQKTFEAYSLQTMGQIYRALGDSQRTISSLTAALRIFLEMGDLQGQGRTSTDLAIQFITIGDYTAAETKLQDATTLSAKAGDKSTEAMAWAYAGLLELHKNNIAAALEKANRSTSIIEQNKLTEAAPIAQKVVGTIYLNLGMNEKARATFEQVLRSLPQDKDTTELEDALLFAGVVYRNLQDLPKAAEYLKRSLTMARNLGDRPQSIAILDCLGTVVAALGNSTEAEGYFQDALKLSIETNNRAMEGVSLTNLGRIYSMQPDPAANVLEILTRALLLSQQLGNRTMEAQNLGGMVNYWHLKKNPELAMFYGKQAINIIQSLRSKLTTFDTDTQRSFIQQYDSSYRKIADILIEYGHISEAETVLAMLKEEEYFDFVRRDASEADQLLSKVSLSPDEQKAFDEYRKYSDQLTALGKEYDELQNESLSYDVGKFPKQPRLDELEKMIANANKVFNVFLDDLKKTLGDKDVRVGGVESGTQAMLKQLKEPRTVFISTISGDDRMNIILTTASVQKAFTVQVKSADLNKLVADVRIALRDPKIDPRPAGKALYDKLLPAALKKDLDSIKADTILWSLDGTLRYVPVAALWDGSKYLVESYRNVVITLASRDNLTKPATDRTTWKMLGAGVSKAATVTDVEGIAHNFPALSAVPDELCRVVADPDVNAQCKTLDGGTSGVVAGKELLDDSFTLSSFKAYVARYPLVHISSHFSLNPGNEDDSFLLLGGGEDRKLTLADIRDKKANFSGVELLTLSACNTAIATGSRSNGVEVEGFGALAQNQGAKSVLASLWSVADSSTRDLMVEFYRQLESDPKITKADALRNAQLKLLYGSYGSAGASDDRRGGGYAPSAATGTPFVKDPKAPFAHPYYWSPFILMGNWK